MLRTQFQQQSTQAYVTFNFKVDVDRSTKRKLNELNKTLDLQLPYPYIPAPDADYHTTFGESILKDSSKSRVARVSVTDPSEAKNIKRDNRHLFNNITQELQVQNTYSMDNDSYNVTGFEISKRGFVFAKLQPNQNVQNISMSYKKASESTAATNQSHAIGLKEFYEMKDPFNMHVSIGKVQLPPNYTLDETERQKLQKKLNSNQNMNRFISQSITFESDATLTASYKDQNDIRQVFDVRTVSLGQVQDKKEDVMEDLVKRLQAVDIDKIEPINDVRYLNDFNIKTSNVVAFSYKPKASTTNKPSIHEIKHAVIGLLPALDAEKLLVKLPSKTESGNYEIVFHGSKQDRNDFCNMFKNTFSGKRGLCVHCGEKGVMLDEFAIDTLLRKNPLRFDLKMSM